MKKQTNKINKKRLANQVLEEGIKKAIEITLIGVIAGFSLSTLFLGIVGITGSSLYFTNNKIKFLEKNKAERR